MLRLPTARAPEHDPVGGRLGHGEDRVATTISPPWTPALMQATLAVDEPPLVVIAAAGGSILRRARSSPAPRETRGARRRVRLPVASLQELVDYGQVSGIELDTGGGRRWRRSRALGGGAGGSLEQLPWDDGTFDLINLPRCRRARAPTMSRRWPELLRVSRPGGWFAGHRAPRTRRCGRCTTRPITISRRYFPRSPAPRDRGLRLAAAPAQLVQQSPAGAGRRRPGRATSIRHPNNGYTNDLALGPGVAQRRAGTAARARGKLAGSWPDAAVGPVATGRPAASLGRVDAGARCARVAAE